MNQISGKVCCGLALLALVASSLEAQPTDRDSSPIVLEEDIEEDPNDRFITKSDGTLRPSLIKDEHSWEKDVPLSLKGPGKFSLIRKKRCGGRDRGNNANRVRGRTVRRDSRQAPKAHKSTTTTTTTITRKVIQNGQVLSQTSETLGANQGQQTVAAASVPLVVQAPGLVAVKQQPVAANGKSISVQASIKIN